MEKRKEKQYVILSVKKKDTGRRNVQKEKKKKEKEWCE